VFASSSSIGTVPSLRGRYRDVTIRSRLGGSVARTGRGSDDLDRSRAHGRWDTVTRVSGEGANAAGEIGQSAAARYAEF
jgi:hypothetical protein